ncbi:MAG: D-2-hydroxyacid dehydrogenase [Spirochaetaceae bacterium]
MNITLLDSATLGTDIDTNVLAEFGNFRNYPATDAKDVAERISTSDVVVTNKVVMDEAVLEAAESLKLICLTATGVNNIDLVAAKRLGIAVANVAGYSTASVAQHTIASTLSLLEHLHYYDDYVKSGRYSGNTMFTHLTRTFWELDGKRWGIIGLGAIGKAVATVARALGCTISYYSTSGRNTDATYPQVALAELLSQSDIVSIHAPLNDRTRGLLSTEQLSLMKRHAVLVNVGRGGIVNEADLAQALRDGRIRAAAIDVFEREPVEPGNPLLASDIADKLLLTPHIAWASVEARTRVIAEVAANIRAFLAGEQRNRVV